MYMLNYKAFKKSVLLFVSLFTVLAGHAQIDRSVQPHISLVWVCGCITIDEYAIQFDISVTSYEVSSTINEERIVVVDHIEKPEFRVVMDISIIEYQITVNKF